LAHDSLVLQTHAATELAILLIPPGNQLEAPKADRRGQHSIRINGQWRVCFAWKPDGAHRAEIVDYHGPLPRLKAGCGRGLANSSGSR